MIKLASAMFAVLAVASPVFAASPENPLAKDAVVLDLKNIDFASVEGQQALAIRLDRAADQVCGDRVATISLTLAEQSRACKADVIADVRSRIEARVARADRTAAGTQIALR